MPFDQANIDLICEVDEQWSYVGNKKNRRWLWYAWSLDLNALLLMHLASETPMLYAHFCRYSNPSILVSFFTDDFSVYSKELPKAKHMVGKRFTQRIERTNLTLRSRLKRLVRKTIGFSKSEEMHDKVIGTFIEREFYW
ncbi:IS1 family transposase [Vibrio vulnificus]